MFALVTRKMKKVTFFGNCEVRQLIGLLALLTLFGFSPSAFSVTFDMDAFVCTGGVGTNGISVTDVTGNPDGATECFGVLEPATCCQAMETIQVLAAVS